VPRIWTSANGVVGIFYIGEVGAGLLANNAIKARISLMLWQHKRKIGLFSACAEKADFLWEDV